MAGATGSAIFRNQSHPVDVEPVGTFELTQQSHPSKGKNLAFGLLQCSGDIGIGHQEPDGLIISLTGSSTLYTILIRRWIGEPEQLAGHGFDFGIC